MLMPCNHLMNLNTKMAFDHFPPLGLYLWEHILEGPLNPTEKVAQWREGELQSGKIDFR